MVRKTTRSRHFGLKVGVTENEPYNPKQIFQKWQKFAGFDIYTYLYLSGLLYPRTPGVKRRTEALLVFDMSLKCMTGNAMGNVSQKTEKREPDKMPHIAWRPLCVITERINLAHRFSRLF